MKIINGLLLVGVMVIGAGCVSSAHKMEGSATDCAFAQQSKTFNEKCSAPRLGWKGATASDFTFSQ